MSAGPLVAELVGVFCLTGLLLHRYGDWRRQHLFCTLSTFIGWYFCFIIVFVLPLDVALTFYRQCVRDHPSTVDSNWTDIGTTSTTGVFIATTPITTTTTTQYYRRYGQFTDNEGDHKRSVPDVHVQPPATADSAASLSLDAKRLSQLVNVTRAALSDCRTPNSYVDRRVLLSLWRVVYWTSQALTWLVLPLMQSYANAGDFTALGRLKTAAYNNAVYYGAYLLIFGALLLYVAAKGYAINAEQLRVILITASNTWGLFLLVLLLGYGLVELPRQLWLMGNKGYRLQKTFFDVEKLSSEKNDAEEAVKEAYQDTRDAVDALGQYHPYMAHAQTVLAKFPSELVAQLSQTRGGATGGGGSAYRDRGSATLRDSDAANLPSNEKSLVRLHKRAIDALQSHHRTQAQWRALINTALHLEEVARNETAGDAVFHRTYSSADRSLLESTICTPSIEWWWECRLKRPLLKLCGASAAAVSAAIVWSECTFFSVSPMLSLAALSVAGAAASNSYAYIELSSIAIIAYLCVCAFYTVFKLRIYRYYHLDPHHQTDENSLLFSAMLLCRLTPPLCLNFLGMIHLDSHVTSDAANAEETMFTHLMGHMDVIAVVASGLNLYLPIAILALCLATYFRLATRLLHSLGIDQFVDVDYDLMTTEMVNGGRALVNLERSRQQREMSREARQDFWAAKLPGGTKAAADEARARHYNRGFAQDDEHQRIDDDPSTAYSDREPILPAMERNERHQYQAGGTDGHHGSASRGGVRTGYGLAAQSPPPATANQQPPRGMFDDL